MRNLRRRVGHPFAQAKHPHKIDHARVRRIAETYLTKDRPISAVDTVEAALNGSLFPITEPKPPASLTAEGTFLRGVQLVGEALAAELDEITRAQRVKALRQPLARAYASLMPPPTRGEREELTESVSKLLGDNSALRSEDRDNIAAKIGELFGVEEEPFSRKPDKARVGRLRRRRLRRDEKSE